VFEDFIADGRVVRGEKDFQKAKALVKMAKQNFSVIKMVPEKTESAAVILSVSYESLRQILEAMALREGYKVYSHEAYTPYLEERGQEGIAAKFDRLRKLRNGIHYYGKNVSLAVARGAKKDVRSFMRTLRKFL